MPQSSLTTHEWVGLLVRGMERLFETGDKEFTREVLAVEVARLKQFQKEMDPKRDRIPIVVVKKDDEVKDVYFPRCLSPYFESHVMDGDDPDHHRCSDSAEIQLLEQSAHHGYDGYDTI